MNRFHFILGCLILGMCLSIYIVSGSCTIGDKGRMIEVRNTGSPFDTVMYLNKNHMTWQMTILENTLDDTAKIGIVMIPPKKTGRLFTVDCFTDTIPFSYRPYKASNGKLLIEYSSGN